MESLILDLIGRIYDAAQDPACWARFLKLYGTAVQCHTTQLELLNDDSKASISAFSGTNMTESADFDDYAAVNPWVPFILRAEVGSVALSHEVVADGTYRKSEYFHNFGRKIDQYYGLAGLVMRSRETICVIGGIRHQRLGPSLGVDQQLLETLIPHLARALRMHSEFVKVKGHSAALLDCLDRLTRGFVLIDNTGHVVRANRAAERMAAQRDGLIFSTEGLQASISNESIKLQKLIYNATQTASGKGLSAGGTIAISRPSGRRPWIALVSPHRSGLASGLASVLIIDSDETQPPAAEIVAPLFGFTPSETRLALLLAQGIRLEDCAARLNITMNTARTHIRRMMDKAGVRRQTDLVILLNKLPT